MATVSRMVDRTIHGPSGVGVDALLILDGTHVNALLDPQRVSEAVEQAFLLHSGGQGRVFPVIREALAVGVFGIKTGEVGDQQLLGFKAAGFWPGNRSVGGEPHQATILLFDPSSGRPYCVLDGNAITTLRTGAAGGLGLARLARTDSRVLTVFGTGIQATIQVSFALRTLPRIAAVNYVTSDGRPDDAFVGRVKSAASNPVALHHCTDVNQAVARSDVVITATPGGRVLFDATAVRPGTHVTAVGADTRGKRELPADLLGRAQVFVDDANQSRQLGELQWSPETPCTEIGKVLSGEAAGRMDAEAITVFDMTGIALQDLTVARMLYQRACAEGVGTRLHWPWR